MNGWLPSVAPAACWRRSGSRGHAPTSQSSHRGEQEQAGPPQGCQVVGKDEYLRCQGEDWTTDYKWKLPIH